MSKGMEAEMQVTWRVMGDGDRRVSAFLCGKK